MDHELTKERCIIDAARLSTLRECLAVCEANGAGDAADEIRQLIQAQELVMKGEPVGG